MKKIGYLLLGLFLMFGLGCTKTDDLVKEAEVEKQLKSADSGTLHYRDNEYGFYLDIYCDDTYVETISGDIEVHWLGHRNKGVRQWWQFKWKGTLIGESGEVFTIHSTDKFYFTEGAWEVDNFRYNVVGDMGSHYIGYGYFGNDTGWEIVMERANCPPNKK
ncbi:MAG: hypothetical protein ABFR62_05215 [Bacteroidota bacterium]